MSKIRFTPWIVLACIGTLAGCTSSEGGPVGNTELNVVIPNNAGQSSAPAAFDIQVVEYTIVCADGANAPLDPIIDSVQPTYDDDITINGVLEVLDTASSGVSTQDFGPDLDEVYVWQGFMDLPPTVGCTVQLRARDADGEVICTEDVTFDINEDDTTKVNVLMYCGISFQAPVGMLDLDGDFSFNVANFCPDLFVLNCIDSELNVRSVEALPGIFVDVLATACQVRFRDADSSCGGDGISEPSSCDPQDCDLTPTGLSCAPRPGFVDPPVATVVVCSSTSGACAISCDGVNPAASCTFTGDTLGGVGDPPPSAGAPGEGGFFVSCATTVDPDTLETIPLAPGDDIVCTAQTDDGDTDCRKTKVIDLTVEGLSACQEFGGDAACDADPNDCIISVCVDATCDGTAANCCSDSNAGQGTSCIDSGGFTGTCDDSGVCVSQDCNAQPDPTAFCQNADVCTVGVCQADGSCAQNATNEGGVCDAGNGASSGSCTSGVCVDICTDVICDDGNECTDDLPCDSSTGSNACPPPVNDDTNACTTCPGIGGVACECLAGVCVDEPLVGPPNYDLTSSIFKPYNSLLPELTGSGDPATDCNVPDLTAAPNSNLTGINTKCLIIPFPDVSGEMTFEDLGGGNFDVTGVQDLLFTIDVTIPAVSARVIIDTDSSTVFTGTATGALPGTLTMDPLNADFNVNAAATGTSECTALNQLFIGFACTVDTDCPFGAACPDPIDPTTPPCGQICDSTTGCLPTDVSTQVCPLANLGPGINPVPLPGDPGQRLFPPITVTDADFTLGGGAAAVNGWYLSNPAPMAGNGTQWVHLSGVRTNP